MGCPRHAGPVTSPPVLWAAVALQIGVLVETRVPWLAVGILLPAAVLVANVVGAAR